VVGVELLALEPDEQRREDGDEDEEEQDREARDGDPVAPEP